MNKIISVASLALAAFVSTATFAHEAAKPQLDGYKNKYVALSLSSSLSGEAIASTVAGEFVSDQYFDFDGMRVAAGYTMIDPLQQDGMSLRPELEFAKNSIGKDDLGYGTAVTDDVEITSLGLNVYLDVNYGEKLRPFIGAGFARASVNAKGDADLTDATAGAFELKDEKTDLTQFMFGANYDYNSKTSLFGSYRITNYDKIKDGGVTLELKDLHMIEAGVRFYF